MFLSGDCFGHWHIVSPFCAHDKNSRHTVKTPSFTLTTGIQVTNVCWYSGAVGVIWHWRTPSFWTLDHVMTQQMPTITVKLFTHYISRSRTSAWQNSLPASCCVTLPTCMWSRVQDHLNAKGCAHYHLDFSLCNFHFFRPLELALIAHIFISADDVLEAVV